MKLAIVLFFLSVTLFAQAPEPEDLDCTKVSALGEMHDARSHKLLLKIRRNHWCVDYLQELRHALAKRDDAASQRDIICDLWEVGPDGPRVDLTFIGGWFGIRASLLLADQEDRVRAIKMPPSDVLFSGTPRTWAVAILERLLPKGPRTNVDDISNEDGQIKALREWRKWIRAHRGELAQMKPTGARVSWANCTAPPMLSPLPPELTEKKQAR